MAIYPVILAGGSGTRLWPISRRNHPKQFLDLLDTGKTLLQSCIERAQLCSSIKPLIIANQSHRFLLMHQIQSYDLTAENVLLEPKSKNTCAAIAAACISISEKDPDASLLIMPCDHYFSDDLAFSKLIKGLRLSLGEAEIGLVGVKPTGPSTQYGYFELDAECESRVTRFIEKPDFELAKQMLDNSNIYWNSGVVFASAKAINSELKEQVPNLFASVNRSIEQRRQLYDFELLGAVYDSVDSVSFDIAVLENAQNIRGVCLEQEWDDLGTWESLLNRREQLGLQKPNVFVENNQALIFGADDIVLVQQDDITMVANKDQLTDIQKLTAYLNNNHLNGLLDRIDIHRPWGQFKVLAKAEHFIVKRLIVHPESQISLQSHAHRNENWVVIKGQAFVQLDNDEMCLTVGESICIKSGQVHRLINRTKEMLEIIEVQTGSHLDEDDIVRYDDQYQRHIGH